MIWGRILPLGVRASHTQRRPPQPATLCRPQPGPTHHRAQQPAIPRSTRDTARNLVSQPTLRAIPSPPSQAAPAAPAAAAVQWLSLPVSSSENMSCDVQTGGGAAGGRSCCCCFNGSCKSSSCSSPLLTNSTSLQATTTSVLYCCCAVLSITVSSTGVTSCDSHLATPAPLSGT